MKEVIKLQDIRYEYPDGTHALKGVDITIFEGNSVGLIGPNGAGKSTLLFHINGILRGKGTVEVLGAELSEKTLEKVRCSVGFVFQDPDDQLFMPTVYDDVSFGPINLGLPMEEVNIAVYEALKKVGMLEAINRISHHLSVGEKKRVALACVLAMAPEILILDEPSSNLDPRSRNSLIAFLKGITSTKIVAGHDLELILEVCNRAVILDQGKVVAQGLPKDILSDKRLMESHGLEVPISLRQRQETFSEKVQ